MIQVPFCYEVPGICEDEDGNKGNGYVKIVLNFKRKLDKECYDRMHKGAFKNVGLDEAKPIGVLEYIENVDCSIEELKILKGNFING